MKTPAGDPALPLRLRPACLDDVEELSGLCLRSKALWGYSDEMLDAFRPELEITTDMIRTSQIQVVEQNGQLVAMARLVGCCQGSSEAWLEALFVDPEWLGQGLGQTLFKWAVERCRNADVVSLLMDADPNAEAFYLRMGACRVGEVASTCRGSRLLPRLQLLIEPAGHKQ